MTGTDELDALKRDELPDFERGVADVLDEWLHTQHGVTSGSHCVGAFFDIMAERGYRVVPVTQ